MKTTIRNPYVWLALLTLILFAVFVILISAVDVEPIGPEKSFVGLATINSFFRDNIVPSAVCYIITQIMGYVALAVALAFAVAGVVQLVKRKHLHLVDWEILALGIIYILTLAAYAGFEIFPLNYRPVLDKGELAASFPSSHTMLFITVMCTGLIAIEHKLCSKPLRAVAITATALLSAAMVVLRTLSGVHWFSDIVGGIILSLTLVLCYKAILSSPPPSWIGKADSF